MADPGKAKPLHEDHRSRMRARVERYGLESLAEHEILEYLLFYVIPRRDTNPIAHALIDRFGSLANVLDASPQELEQVPGVGPRTAHFLHDLQQTQRCYQFSRVRPRQNLDTARKLAAYIVPLFHGAQQEKLLMLALDDRKRLLRTIWLNEGSAASAEIRLSRLSAAAVTAGAFYVVLAHNHPDDVVLPSAADIQNTQRIAQALELLEIHLLDHIIVAGGDWISLRDSDRIRR